MTTNPDTSSLALKRRPCRISTRGRTFPSNTVAPMQATSLDDSGKLRSSHLACDLSYVDLSESINSERRCEKLDNSSGRLSQSSQRRFDNQFYFARQSTLPENSPAWGFDKNECEVTRNSPVSATEQPDDESSAIEDDSPKFLVFKRTRRSTRRMSTWY